jgi:hypothetical protein
LDCSSIDLNLDVRFKTTSTDLEHYPNSDRGKTMDPVVIAAIITAASKAAPTIFEKVIFGTSSSDAKIQKFVSNKYSELKNCVTPPCVELLEFAEDGTYHSVDQFRKHLYPNMAFNDFTDEVAFDHEFEYRLRYLVATGFFINAMGEYYITHLGTAFLAEARDRKEFGLPRAQQKGLTNG